MGWWEEIQHGATNLAKDVGLKDVGDRASEAFSKHDPVTAFYETLGVREAFDDYADSIGDFVRSDEGQVAIALGLAVATGGASLAATGAAATAYGIASAGFTAAAIGAATGNEDLKRAGFIVGASAGTAGLLAPAGAAGAGAAGTTASTAGHIGGASALASTAEATGATTAAGAATGATTAGATTGAATAATSTAGSAVTGGGLLDAAVKYGPLLNAAGNAIGGYAQAEAKREQLESQERKYEDMRRRRNAASRLYKNRYTGMY